MEIYHKCRFCLEECSRNIEIFKEDFPQMIELLTGLKINSNDGLPKTSCQQCYREVKSAMLTRYQILNSHKILLEEIKASHFKFSNETINDARNDVKKEASSTNNNNFEDGKIKNNSLEHNVILNITLDKNSFLEEIEENSNLFSDFISDYRGSNTESKEKFEKVDIKQDPESDHTNSDEDSESESYVEYENSDDSLSGTEADNLIENAEDIIAAAKSNPSKKEERAFKKLIRRLQSHEGRKSSRKKKKQSTTKEYKKKRAVKEEDSIYKVKVNYELKPEHQAYLRSVGKKDRATCPVCSKEMFGANLKSHLITHTYDPTPCHLCGRTSKNAQALQDHINYFHKTTPDRFICDQCGKGFRVPCSLEKHKQREHQGIREKPFECHVCGKRFYEKMQLKNHINITHNKIKPFKCEHCGKDFGRRTQFVTHQLVHTKENRYHCQVCGKGFKIKQTMQTHLKGVHGIEEEKTIFCKICQKGFASAQGLRAHVNSRVHGLEKCEHCSEYITFEYKDIHLKEIHGIDTKNIFS